MRPGRLHSDTSITEPTHRRHGKKYPSGPTPPGLRAESAARPAPRDSRPVASPVDIRIGTSVPGMSHMLRRLPVRRDGSRQSGLANMTRTISERSIEDRRNRPEAAGRASGASAPAEDPAVIRKMRRDALAARPFHAKEERITRPHDRRLISLNRSRKTDHVTPKPGCPRFSLFLSTNPFVLLTPVCPFGPGFVRPMSAVRFHRICFRPKKRVSTDISYPFRRI